MSDATVGSVVVAQSTGAPTPLPSEPISLILSDKDIDAAVVAQVRAQRGGAIVLGGPEELRAVFDAIPSAIGRRVRAIMPEGFCVREIELKLNLGGKVLGIGIEGEVVVKFAPK